MAVIQLSPDTFLATEDGVILTLDQADQLLSTAILRKGLEVADTFEKIDGIDSQLITLDLKGNNNLLAPSHGFLVTVYLSGSDGSLTRMYSGSIIDPADSSVVRGSFNDYITLDIDDE